MGSTKEVSEALDRVILEVMSSMQELSSLRSKYNSAVSEGYFYMAQARHSMGGPSSVSSLQYDGGMTSLVHTTSTFDAESYDDLTKLVTPGKELNVEFQIDRIDPSKPIKSGDSQSKETISQQNGESQLRRRNVGKESSLIEDVPLKSEPTVDGKAGSQDEQKKEDTCETKSPVKDPLKWFGILVPPYLRRSQGHFCQAVLLSAELASVQVRLETMRRKYMELLAKKNKLKEQVDGVDVTDQVETVS